MGRESRTVLMKIIAVLAFAAVAVALPSASDVVPEAELLQVSAFEEAQAAVNAMIKSGKDQGACADLAAATIKEVEDAVNGQQKTLDSLDNGSDCPNKGQASVDSAQSTLDQANKDKNDADAAAASAASADVNFAPKALSGLTRGECAPFMTDPAYTAAKAAAEAAKTAATQAAGAVTAAQDGLKAAQDAQKEAIAACQCAAKKAYKAAWEAANANNDANEKAYTKGKHMACVLAGTSPADCQIGEVPKVTAVTLADGVESATCKQGQEKEEEGSILPGGYNQLDCPAGTSTLTLQECKQVAANGPTDAIKNKDGSALTNTQAHLWASDDLAGNSYPKGCIYQTDHGFWYNNPPNNVGSPYSHGTLVCQGKIQVLPIQTGGYNSIDCPSGTRTLTLQECKQLTIYANTDAIKNKDGSALTNTQAHLWASDDLAGNSYPKGCIYQTDHGFWYNNPPNNVGSPYSHGTLVCQGKIRALPIQTGGYNSID